jgi:hypothetical protein
MVKSDLLALRNVLWNCGWQEECHLLECYAVWLF